MTPLKQRRKIRRTLIYTKGEDQTDTYNVHILRGKIRRTHIYTKGEHQTDTYIYYKIEQHDFTKTKGENQRDTHIY